MDTTTRGLAARGMAAGARLAAAARARLARLARPLGLAVALGLAGCLGGGDGGDETADTVTASSIEQAEAGPVLRFPKQGRARLGRLQGATVEVFDLHSDNPIHTTTTDSNGLFTIDLGDRPLDALYRVQVRGGTDADFDHAGTAGQAAVANTGTLTAIATGTQIVERGVSVSPLSDLLARRVGDGIEWNPTELVLRELNEAAARLVKHDLEGDGVVDYRDVLAFDPLRVDHKGWLHFDWAIVFMKNSQGLSLMDLAHANHPAYADELLALLGDALDIQLPDEDSAELVSLRFDVEGHGSMATAAVPVVLDHDSSRWAQAVTRSATDVILVRATPAAGSRLIGWEGCTADAADPLLCRVTPDATKSVVAVFQDPDRVAPNTSVLHLTSTTGTPVGLVLHETEAIITAVTNDGVVQQLDAALARQAANASHRIFVGADRAKLSTVQISSLVGRSESDGVVRYVVRHAKALVTDALQSGSAYAPPSAISVDTIAALSVSGSTTGNTTLAPENEANGDYVAGPNPVDPAIDGTLCGTTKTQHRLVDGQVACIAGSNLPVQTDHGLTHACAAGEVLVEALDGEDFCVPPQDIHSAAHVNAVRDAAGSRILSFKTAQTGRMRMLALQQPVATSSAPVAYKPGEVVWLLGHGKAIHLSHNVFMVDRADGRGVRMVTAQGAITAVQEGSRAPMAFQQCMGDAAAPECRFFNGSHTAAARSLLQSKVALGTAQPQANLFPDIELVISPEKYRWVTFTFRVNVDLVGEASANFDFGVLWYAFGSRGKIEVAPVFNTSVTADGLALFKRPAGSTSAGDREETGISTQLASGEPVFETDLFRIDFLQKIPGAATVSPVLESALRFSIGADAAGQARIEIETSFRQVIAWDVQSEFTYYVFKSNHNLQSFKVAARGYPGMKLRVDANGSIGMYGKAVVSMGPRDIMPELASLHARYYLYKLEAMGKLLLSYQTEPAKVEAQQGQNFCWAGAVSMTLKRSFDVSAKIDFRPRGFLGDILSYLSMPSWSWTLYSWDGVIMNVGTKRGTLVDEAVLGSDVDLTGVSNNNAADILTSGRQLDCPALSPASMPEEREYAHRNFKLETGHSVYTKTHEYTMQRDGDLVIYNWNGTRGSKVWSSGTAGKARVGGYNHVLMQDDGHLVMYDIVGNPLWSTQVYRVGGNTVRLARRGAIEVWSRNARLWSSDGGLHAQPGSISFTPGNFTLETGDGYTVVNRAFYLDKGVVRWMRMTGNRDDGSFWAYCNNNCHRLVFQADGDLVMYDKNGVAAYRTVTGNKGVTRLTLEQNGRFVIAAGNNVIWKTTGN